VWDFLANTFKSHALANMKLQGSTSSTGQKQPDMSLTAQDKNNIVAGLWQDAAQKISIICEDQAGSKGSRNPRVLKENQLSGGIPRLHAPENLRSGCK
jgi:hypothetical protein